MEYGILYGVSVGPGDPELITVKALRTMEKCPVIAVPRTGGTKTLALDIARQAMDLSGKEILYLDHRMVRDADTLRAQYREDAAILTEYLQQGKDVALLNLGDVSVYSTYCYIAEEVKNRFPL
jgi:sirohydrochlorin cobaltochelatase